MSKRRRISAREIFWKEHIQKWFRSSLTQSEYCVRQNISKSSFSKWKNKLRPKLKGKIKRYKTKSKYYKFTNLSDEKIEELMHWFLVGMSAKQSAKSLGISIKSVYKFYDLFRDGFIVGALNYPKLFFGAGMVLALGPPENMWGCMQYLKTRLPYFKISENNATENGWLKKSLYVTYQILILNTLFEWTEAEAAIFRKYGAEIFYRNKHSKSHENDFDSKKMVRILEKIPAPIIALKNWQFWASKQKPTLRFGDEMWEAIYHNRKIRPPTADAWMKPLLRDLKWSIKSIKLEAKNKTRNKYWDESRPSFEEEKAALRILDYNLRDVKLGREIHKAFFGGSGVKI